MKEHHAGAVRRAHTEGEEDDLKCDFRLATMWPVSNSRILGRAQYPTRIVHGYGKGRARNVPGWGTDRL